MILLDHEDLVRHLIELLHLSISEQRFQVLEVLRLIECTGDCKLFLILFGLVPIVVFYRNVLTVTPSVLQLLRQLLQ